tara:strand:+ start:1717 stop:2025 length:309 start_codon:yes stop_codon:yes gene_type:complete
MGWHRVTIEDDEGRKVVIEHRDRSSGVPMGIGMVVGDAIIAFAEFRTWVEPVLAHMIIHCQEHLESELNGLTDVGPDLVTEAKETLEHYEQRQEDKLKEHQS